MQAAEALGEAPARVLKTLMAMVDEKPVCAIVPSDREVALKRLAAAFGGKSARMMKPAEAERISGYKVGGISPFGQKRKLPTAIEAGGAGARARFHQRRSAGAAGSSGSEGGAAAAGGGGGTARRPTPAEQARPPPPAGARLDSAGCRGHR